MSWWIKPVLIGLISLFCLGLNLSAAIAANQPPAVDREENPDAVEIVPELTNPAEIPVAEAAPPSDPLLWFRQPLKEEQAPESDRDRNDPIDDTLEQWVSLVKTFLGLP